MTNPLLASPVAPGFTRARFAWLGLACGLGLLSLWALVGCAESDRVTARLHAHPIPFGGNQRLAMEAQITGPDFGLRYKWFAVYGECDPEVTDTPQTVFVFSEMAQRDRVVMEIWRGNERIAQDGINVNFRGDPNAGIILESESDLKIEITTIPPWESGGPDTHADIAGRITGEVPADARVIIYARAYDSWFIQPDAGALHPITADNRWSTWTHTGESYAAVLVKTNFLPVPRLDMLPRVGGSVLARTYVAGERPK